MFVAELVAGSLEEKKSSTLKRAEIPHALIPRALSGYTKQVHNDLVHAAADSSSNMEKVSMFCSNRISLLRELVAHEDSLNEAIDLVLALHDEQLGKNAAHLLSIQPNCSAVSVFIGLADIFTSFSTSSSSKQEVCRTHFRTQANSCIITCNHTHQGSSQNWSPKSKKRITIVQIAEDGSRSQALPVKAHFCCKVEYYFSSPINNRWAGTHGESMASVFLWSDSPWMVDLSLPKLKFVTLAFFQQTTPILTQ